MGRETVRFVHCHRYRTKSDRPRQLPLTQTLWAALDPLRAQAGSGRVFPSRAAAVWYWWQTIPDDLRPEGVNLDDAVLHTLRHTCLTRLAKRLPIHKVSLWAGHSDIKVTVEHYAHLSGEDLLEGLAVLDAT